MERTTSIGAAGIALAAALLAGCTGGNQQHQGQGGQEDQVPPATAPPQAPARQPQDAAAAKAALQQQIDQALQQNPITFRPDSAEFTTQGQQSAAKAAELAGKAPQELKFAVAGFVANTGTPSPKDQELAQQRAQAVADEFTRAGVAADRVQVEGRGAAQGAQQSDRRVEITVQ